MSEEITYDPESYRERKAIEEGKLIGKEIVAAIQESAVTIKNGRVIVVRISNVNVYYASGGGAKVVVSDV